MHSSTDAVIVKFKLREVFPIHDIASVPFLGHGSHERCETSHKLVLSHFAKEPANETEALVREGELILFHQDVLWASL